VVGAHSIAESLTTYKPNNLEENMSMYMRERERVLVALCFLAIDSIPSFDGAT
jgi:hypothetical protein